MSTMFVRAYNLKIGLKKRNVEPGEYRMSSETAETMLNSVDTVKSEPGTPSTLFGVPLVTDDSMPFGEIVLTEGNPNA